MGRNDSGANGKVGETTQRRTGKWAKRPGFTLSYEPPRNKTNKMTVRPAKTQISLGIRPVWSETSLCAQWVAKDPRFLHADSEDSDQTGRMPRLIWVFAGRTCNFVGFVMCRLIFFLSFFLYKKSALHYWGHIRRKPVYTICEHQRRRSACASEDRFSHTVAYFALPFIFVVLKNVIPIVLDSSRDTSSAMYQAEDFKHFTTHCVVFGCSACV